MFDLRWIRENPDAFDNGLEKRGLQPLSAQLLSLDESRRHAQTRAQEAQAKRNDLTKQIGKAKASGANADALMADVAALKQQIQASEGQEKQARDEIEALLHPLPNLPADDVPVGADEAANVELRRHGTPPDFDFKPKQHFELGEALGLMDFETAARLSGSRFVVLRGALTRLERALATFMLETHTSQNGYQEVSGPLLVRDHTAFGTGNLPKFAEDLFQTKEGLYLIPTSEMTLTNLVREQILDAADLPLRFTSYTPCFRSEAGAAGRDTRGMIRMHQFSKVELVSITAPEQSDAELERKTQAAEDILQKLGLAYRVLLLSSGDMGAAARKTYDLEVWLPGQNAYREISSCSNCGDYQARRMNARMREADKRGTRYVHSLNGSGLAVGRALVAVLENYQNADGSITIPEILRPFMGGQTVIEAA